MKAAVPSRSLVSSAVFLFADTALPFTDAGLLAIPAVTNALLMNAIKNQRILKYLSAQPWPSFRLP